MQGQLGLSAAQSEEYLVSCLNFFPTFCCFYFDISSSLLFVIMGDLPF